MKYNQMKGIKMIKNLMSLSIITLGIYIVLGSWLISKSLKFDPVNEI